jgi:hypothetical protein
MNLGKPALITRCSDSHHESRGEIPKEVSMHKLLLGIAGVATLAVASSASAAVVVGSNAPGTSPYSGPAATFDFDTPGTTPVTIGGGVITTGTTSGLFAQPFGSSGNYYSVGPSTSSPGTIDLSSFGDIFAISILWGSIDTYNTLEFIDSVGNVIADFTGTEIVAPANGDQSNPATNRVVQFNFGGGDESLVAGIRLTSPQNAFELDNIAVNPVPEPATWAMMLLGFGAVGFAMRRRRRPVLMQLA